MKVYLTVVQTSFFCGSMPWKFSKCCFIKQPQGKNYRKVYYFVLQNESAQEETNCIISIGSCKLAWARPAYFYICMLYTLKKFSNYGCIQFVELIFLKMTLQNVMPSLLNIL